MLIPPELCRLYPRVLHFLVLFVLAFTFFMLSTSGSFLWAKEESPLTSPKPTSLSGVDSMADSYASFKSIKGPVILTSGQRLVGVHVTSSNGPCIVVTQASNVLIENNHIGPCKSGDVYAVGVNAESVDHLEVKHNRFIDNSTAFYMQGKGNTKSSDHIVFEGNLARGIRGPMPRGQMVQLNAVNGSDIIIRCNVSDQAIGGYGSGPEDHINIYKSSGTPQSPIQILHNKLRGGGSKSGGGILSVDDGDGANVVIAGNILVNPGQYGIGVPSGTNVKVVQNLIYSRQYPWTNVGIYVWNQYPKTACDRIEVSGNRVNYINKVGAPNPYWDSKNCGNVEIHDKNTWNDTTLSSSIWDALVPQCSKI